MPDTRGMDWSDLYENNIRTYQKGRPKRGMFIAEYLIRTGLHEQVENFLEEGSFSAKDSIYLANRFPGKTCIATDLNESAMRGAALAQVKSCVADAFALPFAAKQFAVTFHSGLIVLFDNADALRIVNEQLRVTEKVAFTFAHNQHNFLDGLASRLKRLFGKKIFNFRRYTWADLQAIGEQTGLPYEVIAYDNMLENFLSRNVSWLLPAVKLVKLHRSRVFANELVLIIKP
ncbi:MULTISPECIES: class I SAM-dependent methyltransferase [Pseudomonas]|uniref:class I SAM-dependent methyltransferase n=1 Tax=Pseudomonas nitroreducens TaxID=46680 RepID=UPI00147B874C|nr:MULTISPECIES: class I SAM-dependent methyltransferase [Pseudomonas]NNN26856.1 class I SAM-dependent methyltransferase [Pseudomonas nitroreducens]